MTYDSSSIAPYSQDAEEAVLGAVLINPEAYIALGAFLRAEDFFILRHQFVWEAIAALVDRNETVDLLTVREELRSQNRLNDIGGPGYLTQLTLNVPTAVHAEVYGRLVERSAARRRLLSVADEIRGLAMDETVAWDAVANEAEQKVFAITGSMSQPNTESFRQLASNNFDTLEHRMSHPDEPVGLPTGYKALDELLTGGLRRGELLFLGGRPGMGKSSLGAGICLNVARLGGRVLYVNLEMTNDQLFQRMLAVESGVSTTRMKGELTPAEWTRVLKGLNALGGLPIWADDTASMSLRKLKRLCQRVQQLHGLDLVIIDHALLLKSPNKQNNRLQEVSDITYFLKHEIAKDLHVPVLAQMQLSRALESRKDKRPQLSDLRDSGTAEQDADIVLFLYRDAVYNDATEFPNLAEVIVAKNRDGATGTINLHYEGALTRFADARTQTIDLSML